MTFQTSVATLQGFGVVGERYNDAPHRANPYALDSVAAADNVVGRAFSVKSQGIAEAGNPDGKPFAGILINPKSYAARGTALGGTLAPTLTLNNGEVAEICPMGTLIVSLANASNIGDKVAYDTDGGALSAVAPLASFTGVIAVTTGVLTVSSLAAGGYIAVGSELSGTGVPGGTRITAQLSGTAGSNGTYQTNIDTAVSSTTMTVPNSPLAAGADHEFVPTAEVVLFDASGSGLAVISLTAN